MPSARHQAAQSSQEREDQQPFLAAWHACSMRSASSCAELRQNSSRRGGGSAKSSGSCSGSVQRLCWQAGRSMSQRAEPTDRQTDRVYNVPASQADLSQQLKQLQLQPAKSHNLHYWLQNEQQQQPANPKPSPSIGLVCSMPQPAEAVAQPRWRSAEQVRRWCR